MLDPRSKAANQGMALIALPDDAPDPGFTLRTYVHLMDAGVGARGSENLGQV